MVTPLNTSMYNSEHCNHFQYSAADSYHHHIMEHHFIEKFRHQLPLKKRPLKEISDETLNEIDIKNDCNYNYPIYSFDSNFPMAKRHCIRSISPVNSEFSSYSLNSFDSGFIENSPLDLSSPNSLRRSKSPIVFQFDPEIVSVITSESGFMIKCQECSKQFTNRIRFRAHLRRHESKRSGRYRCSECHKTFVQRSSLTTHLRIHTGEKPFKCTECNNCFGDFSTFTKHKRIHNGEKPYPCPVCQRSFSQSGNMHRHLKAVHGNQQNDASLILS